VARVELIDVGMRIADGESIDWSSRDLTTPDPAVLAVLQQLQLLERIAAIHASSLPPAHPEGFASLDLDRTTQTTESAAPLRWGRLDIIRKVGRGTFGDVYLAHDRSLDRPVALKLLRHRERDRGLAATDVIEEGRLLARVRHPNIVAVYGAERIDERVGVWTEYVEGVTLADELRSRGPLRPEEVASIGEEVSRALEVVHAAGLLHRDIKAQNVMRDVAGRVLLTDFGASRLAEDNDESAGELAGTPICLAPEVLSGGPATRASDIYSLGVLLHYLASGRYPVSGRSIRDLRDAHELGHRTSVGAARPGLPRHLAVAIDRATDPNPARRFPSAGALADALRPISPVTTPAAARSATLPALLIVALVVVVGGLAALIQFGRLAGDPAADTPGVSTQQFWPAWQATAIPSAVSPDGKWVLCTIRPSGQLAQCPIDGSAPSAVAPIRARPYPLLSPDGRRVAYIRFRPDEPFRLQDTGEVHVAFLDGSDDQVAMARNPAEGALSLHGWSGDGTTIAVLFQPGLVPGKVSAPAPAEVTLLAATTLKPVATGQLPLQASFARLSRDGRSLVFMRPAPEGDGDIWTMDVGSGEPKSLVTGAARDARPFWSATGSSVLFTSDRGGTYGLWRVALEQGRAAGPPELVRDLGRAIAWPYGFTRTGRLFLGLQSIGFDSHVAEIDPASATVIRPPVRIARDPLDANATPDWSPDGRLLAFVSARGQQSIVTIQTVSGQVQIQFPIQGQYFQTRFRWLPDGQSALIGLNAPLQRYDLATGQLLGTMAPSRQPADGIDVDALSGRMVYSNAGEILVRDLTTGAERVRLRASAGQRVVYFSMSPDGQQLAVSRADADGSFSLDLADPTGTALRTILTSPHLIVPGPWTREGRYLLFSRILDTANAQSEIIVLEIATGVARPLPIAMPQIWQMRLHPDGRRLAFVTGPSGQEMALMSGAALR
jgi:Tol biopolymer transport system component